jgi:hypothetical protein
MRSLRFMDRQAGNRLASAILLLTLVAPALLPAFASAADVTDRSVAISSSAASATSVNYDVKFTAGADADAFVLSFCSDSPLAGQTCTAPTDFDASGAATSSSGATIDSADANLVKITKDINDTDDIDVLLTGIDNPSVTGALYVRILTYVGTGNGSDYDNYVAGGTVVGAPEETGGVALAITDGFGVAASVRESMTFCMASLAITADCANAAANAPALDLGVDSGGTRALTTAVSTGDVYVQMSTNAAHGAIVNLKSNATGCGGLMLFGDTTHCYIAPAASDITTGSGKFGLKLGTAASASGAADSSGTLQAAGTGYSTSVYHLNAASDNSTGVTSTYGDTFLGSNSLPVNNKNMQVTFGAAASNSTPAGKYAATLNMIAAGTF